MFNTGEDEGKLKVRINQHFSRKKMFMFLKHIVWSRVRIPPWVRFIVYAYVAQLAERTTFIFLLVFYVGW